MDEYGQYLQKQDSIDNQPATAEWLDEIAITLIEAFGWTRNPDGTLSHPNKQDIVDLRPTGWYMSHEPEDWEEDDTWDRYQPKSSLQAAFAGADIETAVDRAHRKHSQS